jgi:hypothetical protein
MAIDHAPLFKTCAETFLSELGIMFGPGDGPDIYELTDVKGSQHRHKLIDGTGRVTDRINGTLSHCLLTTRLDMGVRHLPAEFGALITYIRAFAAVVHVHML